MNINSYGAEWSRESNVTFQRVFLERYVELDTLPPITLGGLHATSYFAPTAYSEIALSLREAQ